MIVPPLGPSKVGSYDRPENPRTRMVSNFAINPTHNESFFNLHVLFNVSQHVTAWQLEYTLCSLRQYLESRGGSGTNPFRCRVTAIEQETVSGIQTEFWITTNSWLWTKAYDEEVKDVLSLFMPIVRSDVTVLAWNAPTTDKSIVIIEEIEVPAPVTSVPDFSPLSVPSLKKDKFNNFVIDALVASWAELPSPGGQSYSPLSDWGEEEDGDISPLSSPEPSPDTSPELSPELSPQSSPRCSPDSSPESSPQSSPEPATDVDLPLHDIFPNAWLTCLLESWPKRWPTLPDSSPVSDSTATPTPCLTPRTSVFNL